MLNSTVNTMVSEGKFVIPDKYFVKRIVYKYLKLVTSIESTKKELLAEYLIDEMFELAESFEGMSQQEVDLGIKSIDFVNLMGHFTAAASTDESAKIIEELSHAIEKMFVDIFTE